MKIIIDLARNKATVIMQSIDDIDCYIYSYYSYYSGWSHCE